MVSSLCSKGNKTNFKVTTSEAGATGIIINISQEIDPEVGKYLWHKHPSLFITRICKFDLEGKTITAEFKVEKDHCKGHTFYDDNGDGYDVFSGIKFIEGMAQTAGCLYSKLRYGNIPKSKGPIGTLASMGAANLSGLIFPDDVITFEAIIIDEIKKDKEESFLFDATTSLGKIKIASVKSCLIEIKTREWFEKFVRIKLKRRTKK